MEKTLVIIGAGPAGLTAGMYAVRAGLVPLVIEKAYTGGSMVLTERIDNYPGFPEGITGFELTEKMKSQYVKFGGKLSEGECVAEVLVPAPGKPCELVMQSGRTMSAGALIVASGSSRKKLGIEGELEYTGKGVSSCAVCDGAFFRNKAVAVIGGGNSALEEAVYLTRYVRECYLVHRRDAFRASPYLQEELKKYPAVKPVLSSVPERIEGRSGVVTGIELRDRNTGEKRIINVEGVFVSIGQNPNVDFIDGKVEQNPAGYIITDYRMQTSERGIFACGDVIKKSLYQVVTACGEGATAAYSAEQYLSGLAS